MSFFSHEPVWLGLSRMDWTTIVLASLIIFAIIGGKLWKDVKGWLA